MKTASLIRWTVLVSVLLIVIAVVIASLQGQVQVNDLPHGWNAPLLALQFAESPDDIKQILAPMEQIASLRKVIIADFPFIAAYTTLFALFGMLLLRRRTRKFYHWLGTALIVIAGLTAAVDCVENVLMLQILSSQIPSTAPLTLVTETKWVGTALMALLASVLFWVPGRIDSDLRLSLRLVMLLLALSAAISLWGALDYHHALEHSLDYFALATLIFTAALSFKRNRLEFETGLLH